jgi:hypothetical protein
VSVQTIEPASSIVSPRRNLPSLGDPLRHDLHRRQPLPALRLGPQLGGAGVDGGRAAQDVVQRPDAFQLVGHPVREHGELPPLIGLLSHRPRSLAIEERDRLIVAADDHGQHVLQ